MKLNVTTGSNEVQDCLTKLDVDLVGICSVDDFKGTKLEEMALRLLPGTNSIVVFAMEVFPEILGLAKSERITGAGSMIELLERHQEFLGSRLTKSAYDVAKVSRKNGLKAFPLPAAGCPIDTRFLSSVFSYKHAAQTAGLGYIGRSSLLITQNFGPRVRLACCLTEAVLESTKVPIKSVCSGCDVCISICPAKALGLPGEGKLYEFNKFACSSFRNASGGCAECMKLCPAGNN